MISPVKPNVNVCYFTTTPKAGKNFTENDGEIVINTDKVKELVKETQKQGFYEGGFLMYKASELNEYIKVMNKIMPKDVKYMPKLDPEHKYSLLNADSLIQAWDETENKQVFEIGGSSLYKKA